MIYKWLFLKSWCTPIVGNTFVLNYSTSILWDRNGTSIVDLPRKPMAFTLKFSDHWQNSSATFPISTIRRPIEESRRNGGSGVSDVKIWHLGVNPALNGLKTFAIQSFRWYSGRTGIPYNVNWGVSGFSDTFFTWRAPMIFDIKETDQGQSTTFQPSRFMYVTSAARWVWYGLLMKWNYHTYH